MSSLPLPRSCAVPVSSVDVFTAGHLGELTQYLPVELVDDVLEHTKTTQRRLRDLPSRVGVYFLLALGMFPRLGYARVWDKLTAGLPVVRRPSEKALRDLRRRLGPAPLKVLFEMVAGPLGQPRTPGVCYRGLRTVAFDGLHSLKAPDTRRNRAWLGRIHYRMGWAGYPTLRVMALVETGTRALLGAAVGGADNRDEPTLATDLLGLLRPGMLVLLDRAFDSTAFLEQITRTGAQFLVRSKQTRKPRVLRHLSDGSYLSLLDGVKVRIIEADLVMTGADGSRVGDRYRLITTLTDHHRHPAGELTTLYHERWEIETAFLALRHTILNGHVLRSGDQPGLEQELWALLTLYQLLRMAMVTAVETQPGTNPDRASFTTALETARDQVTAAQNIHPTQPTDLLGIIGRAVLATLLPPRRPRFSARKVKCPTSRYLNRDDGRPPHTTTITITTIDTAIHTPALTTTPPPRTRTPHDRTTPLPATRRARVINLMNTDPHRNWNGTKTSHTTRHPSPQPAHPTRRMGTTRPTHQNNKGPLHPQPPTHLDNPTNPLTTRHCLLTGLLMPGRTGRRLRRSGAPLLAQVADRYIDVTLGDYMWVGSCCAERAGARGQPRRRRETGRRAGCPQHHRRTGSGSGGTGRLDRPRAFSRVAPLSAGGAVTVADDAGSVHRARCRIGGAAADACGGRGSCAAGGVDRSGRDGEDHSGLAVASRGGGRFPGRAALPRVARRVAAGSGHAVRGARVVPGGAGRSCEEDSVGSRAAGGVVPVGHGGPADHGVSGQRGFRCPGARVAAGW